MLAPAAMLVLWTMAMLGWLALTRVPAIGGLRGLLRAPPGARGQDLESVLPPRTNWKSHNYSHLTEQPTLFYAVSAILAITSPGLADVRLAWGYVVLRVIHSIWQAQFNLIAVRFALFGAASFCLLALAIDAARVTLGM